MLAHESATRTHHLTPPLPGALRLRLLCLRRVQRTAYLAARLGAKGTELRTRIDTNPSLDELTRTPFILSEVASPFEAGAKIPSTKMGFGEQRSSCGNAFHNCFVAPQHQPLFSSRIPVQAHRNSAPRRYFLAIAIPVRRLK